jgi:hypothetical protein
MAQGVSGQWKEGAVVLNDGRTLEGQAQGQTYKGNDVQSLLYRKEKGTDAGDLQGRRLPAGDLRRPECGGRAQKPQKNPTVKNAYTSPST